MPPFSFPPSPSPRVEPNSRPSTSHAPWRLSARVGYAYRKAKKELSEDYGEVLVHLTRALQELGELQRPTKEATLQENLDRARPEVQVLAGLLAALATPVKSKQDGGFVTPEKFTPYKNSPDEDWSPTPKCDLS